MILGFLTSAFSLKMGSSILLFKAIVCVFSTFLFCNTSLSKPGNQTDYQTLLSLKANIVIDPLQFTSSWNESTHFCEWVGITCGHKHHRVTKLDLHSSNLEGSLSPYIGNLSFLRELLLFNNSFIGVIPAEIGKLARLQVLNLQNNSFSGEIPKTISHCFNLIDLRLNRNGLTGRFPLEFQSLAKLQYLSVSQNNLSGEIPSYIANFTSLNFLSFGENNFGGNIPDSLGKLNRLYFVSLDSNKLSGTIPTSIFNLSSLETFGVSENRLRGYLPPTLPSTLVFLNIYANFLTGPLLKSISNLTKLTHIDVAKNGFTGVPAFTQLKQLKYVGLSGNPLGHGKPTDLDFMSSLLNSTATLQSLLFFSCNFGGVLPKFIGNFSRLKGLAVYANQIHGEIPHEIHFLVDLERLDMSGNQLSGTIPSAMGKLPKLYVLDISGNKLSGEIPTSFANLSMLSNLYLCSNNLKGTIPSILAKSRFLSYIDFSENNLTGHLPKELFSPTSSFILLNLSCNHFRGHLPIENNGGLLKNLILLDLSNNMLSGELPSSLGTLSGLVYLNISSNFFCGFIPPSFSSLQSLQSIDLSSNNLTGKIPEFLGKLQYLKQLNLSFNHFEGEIPMEGIFKNGRDVELYGNNLCGGIPQFGLPKCTKGERKHLSHIQKLAILIPSGTLNLTIVGFVVFIYKRKKMHPSMVNAIIEFMPKVSYWSIHEATNGFSKSNIIGSGKFSTVYKGILNDSLVIVAIKVFKLEVRGAPDSFLAECKALKQIRHRNLVKILTSCCSIDHEGNDFKAIVYEYMVNGSLDNWLHSHIMDEENNYDSKILNLLRRVNIALDVATALDYLHNHLETHLVHCDLKPSNILLDGDMVTHVGDFGLAKFLPIEITHESSSEKMTSSTGIKGTIGYTAPEYGMGSAVSTSGDVYSYGILLLEIFAGKSPTSDIFNSNLSLHNYVKMAIPEQVIAVMDPKLFYKEVDATTKNLESGDLILECIISLFKIGVACSVELPKERMNIGCAIKEMHSIKDSLMELAGDFDTIPL